ncbi:MAG: hypothetical protein PHF56_11650 [Desulfuromonadaceae bacterium]|nr:hypothetical protein [Desulfuromonadaceae bacterium]
MKKGISTLIALGFISTLLVNTSYAGDRHESGISPLWLPVAIISTLAAVAIAHPQPVVYEQRVRYEPRQQIIIREEPRHRYTRYYESDRAYEAPRRHDYR